MGITRVANVTGLDVLGVPVVAVVRPNSRSVAVAQGKGLDLTSAKVSGLMESIENFHAESILAPLLLASWNGLRGHAPTIDLSGLPRVAGSSFDPGQRLLWIEGYDAAGRRPVWLPFELVHVDYTLPLPPGSGAFMMSDSGIASGNHPLEATSHAICELVERDAVTLWQVSSDDEKRAKRIDLDTVDDDACRSVLDRFAHAGVRALVWNITSDVGIPSFFCTILDPGSGGWRPVPVASGAGCHPCREIALLRALTEAAQTRLTIIAGSRDDLGQIHYDRERDREAFGRFAAWGEGTCEPAGAFGEVPTFSGATFRDDVAHELKSLKQVGVHEVVVIDLARREIGIPVVRVVIPGLEGMADAPGFTPGKRARAKLT
jgi:ribosomal protein S12 methylthiotransferase accessory factor